jgi:hypothetical protein
MKCWILLTTTLLCLVASFGSPTAFASRDPYVSVQSDHSNQLYSPGEKATFTFDALVEPSSPRFSVELQVNFSGLSQDVRIPIENSAQYVTPVLASGFPVMEYKVHWIDRAQTQVDENEIKKIDSQIQFWQDALNQAPPNQVQTDQQEIAQFKTQKSHSPLLAPRRPQANLCLPHNPPVLLSALQSLPTSK